MSRRGKQMPYPERLACGEQALAGKTDTQLAQETGWSRWTIRKWRRAYARQGAVGLAPVLGRPKQGALSTYPLALSTTVERLRRSHPGWGPITLLAELMLRPAYAGVPLPSRARLAAFLKAKHLVRHYEHRVPVPQAPPQAATAAHDEWELDAQGRQVVAGLGTVSVVNIMDVVSRLKVASYPHLWHSGLTWQDYQFVLRCAFVEYGLPQSLSLDHDSAWFDNTSQSPYPSRLHLWLTGLGIAVRFITQPPPKQHALIERGHQTMTAQTLTGQTWPTVSALWQGLEQRRTFLNTVYPSRALDYRAPLEADPTARRSPRAYRPEWEADLFDLQRVYTWLALGHWFRETSLHGEFGLGMQRYNTGRSWAHATVEIRFDPATLEFRVTKVGTTDTQRFAAKGLAPADLMGELPPFFRMPVYQLALPFTLAAWRQTTLGALASGTISSDTVQVREVRLYETPHCTFVDSALLPTWRDPARTSEACSLGRITSRPGIEILRSAHAHFA